MTVRLLGPIDVPGQDRAPRQLPPAPTGFTGRDRELAGVLAGFGAPPPAGSVPTVVISGSGGVGKSALAMHAGHRLAGAFPDGQLYVDLRGAARRAAPRDPAEVLDRLLLALGAGGGGRPYGVAEAAARLRAVTAGRRLLVVLDNARDESQVRPLVPAGTGCGVLVTSRRALPGLPTTARIDLDVLTESAAVELLRGLVGNRRVAAEPAAVAAVARCCGYLPLALRAAGVRLAARPHLPIAVLARRLADERCRLDELDRAELGLRRSLAVSYRELAGSPDPVDREAARTFVRLGRCGPAGLAGLAGGEAAAVLERPVPEAERLLARLVDARLLARVGRGSYRLPDLLRLLARELPAPRPGLG